MAVTTSKTEKIRVLVIHKNKDFAIKNKKFKEDRVQMDKKGDWEVEFSGDCIGRAWVRDPSNWYRHKYLPAIMVREGSNKAIPLNSQGDFIPPLTQKENSEMIKHKIAQAISKGSKLMTLGQFIAIMIMLAIIVALVAANLFGVHLTGSIGPGITPAPTNNGTTYVPLPWIPWA